MLEICSRCAMRRKMATQKKHEHSRQRDVRRRIELSAVALSGRQLRVNCAGSRRGLQVAGAASALYKALSISVKLPAIVGSSERNLCVRINCTFSHVRFYFNHLNKHMSIPKRERWTEGDVLALPSGEHEYFDRKSGALLSDKDFEKDLAKALSAFSNSGGGHLLIGVRDNGSFDGVPRLHKGRESTRDWLEQVAPNVVSYPLQDIRVHEVEPSTPSAIPSGHVLIVIDVGDSNLAPHQSIYSYIYYYRVGGRSKPAPHFYLETLRGRERYPSREVAKTWRDVVLNPLINTLEREQEYLATGKWTWSANTYRQSLSELNHLSSRRSLTGNHEEFLEFHPDVKKQMVGHDQMATAVYGRCLQLFRAVVDSPLLLEAYEQATSPNELQRLRDADYQSSQATTDEALLGKLFGTSSSVQANLKALAEFIVNRSINHGSTIRPLWELQEAVFLQVLQCPPVSEFDHALNSTRDELQHFNEQFISQVKAVRTTLIRQHGIPVEEQRQPFW
jgi:hypothetical protein